MAIRVPSLAELKTYINPRAPIDNPLELHDSLFGGYEGRRSRLDKMGEFDGVASKFMPGGSKVGKIDIVNNLIKTNENLTDVFAGFNSELGGSEGFSKFLEKDAANLKKHAGKLYKDLHVLEKNNLEAVQKLQSGTERLVTELRRDFEGKARPLTAQIEKGNRGAVKQLENLTKRYEHALEGVSRSSEVRVQYHSDVLEAIKDTRSEFEIATKTKAADYVGKVEKAIEKESSAVAATAEKAVEKEVGVIGRTFKNLKMGSSRGWIGSIVTLGLGADAVRRAFKLVTGGEKNPDGTEQSTAGEIPIIAAEVGGAGLALFKLAGHGRN